MNNNHVPGVGIDQHPVGGFDYVIDCTGFNIDVGIFGNFKPKHNGKVPFIKGNFQSVNVNNLFFAGKPVFGLITCEYFIPFSI